MLWCGSVNIGLLLTSSLTMVLAINAAAAGRRRHLTYWLLATVALGIAFVRIKGLEWYLDFVHHDVPHQFHYEAGGRPGRRTVLGVLLHRHAVARASPADRDRPHILHAVARAPRRSDPRYVIAWLILVLLTGVSTGAAFRELGIYRPAIEFGSAATQAAITSCCSCVSEVRGH
jgi:hypothetical protein